MKKMVAVLVALVMCMTLANTSFASSSREVTWGVNLRSEPTTQSSVIRMLPKGEKVEVLEQVNSDWLKVEAENGRTGYISADSKYTQAADSSSSATMSALSTSSKADAIIRTAKSLIGRAEYDLGTRNPSRLIFDCSSFTQYVFAKHGVDFKWGTRFQKNEGSYVSKSNLKKGDLVFFSMSSNSSSIAHVGIYIGGGEFIHILDVSGSDVHISSLDSGKWKDRYVTARRVL